MTDDTIDWSTDEPETSPKGLSAGADLVGIASAVGDALRR